MVRTGKFSNHHKEKIFHIVWIYVMKISFKLSFQCMQGVEKQMQNSKNKTPTAMQFVTLR